jgi:FkbM family methyltransferase
MIARAFPRNYQGFYVDIGAAHPENFSVTCHFYNNGWSGINVEPSLTFYPLLCEARPNDINVKCAIGRRAERAPFFEVQQYAENSTLERDVAAKMSKSGQRSIVTHEVDVMRLVDLCDMYVKGRTIDFMKIDVEGGELGVLEGADWERYRPRLLIIEATVVNSPEENYATWEPILTKARYHKVWFDGLNNFYLREEDLALSRRFRSPANVFDGFETAELVAIRQAVESLQQKTAALQQKSAAQEAERDTILSSRSWRATAPLRAVSIHASNVWRLLRDRLLFLQGSKH